MPPEVTAADEIKAAPRALLFDMDGTILDSDPVHIAVFADMMRPYGIEVDEAFYNEHVIGGRNTEIFARFLPGEDPFALDLEKEAEYRRRIAKLSLVPTAGLFDLLDRAGAEGIPRIVVTNACRANLEAVIAALGVENRFDAFLSADDCVRGKPHPEIYMRAADMAGFQPSQCVAFEDSHSGVASAHAAGCRVVGMTTSLTKAKLAEAGASHFARDFHDPSLEAVLGPLAADFAL